MTIQEKYNKHINGEISKEKFLYESRRDTSLSQFITNMTSYDDAVKILKNRGIITEAKKKAEALTLDESNPYELRKGLDYELDLCYKASPAKPLPEDTTLKAQDKVLKNLAKDPNFYTKTLAGIKPDGDLASDSELGEKSKRADVYYSLGKDNFIDKKNGVKEVSKLDKSNVKDTLGNKERAKNKNAKGVKLMTIVPKKSKGVKVMDMPGKEKKIKLKESIQSENIPSTNSSFLPFASVKPGMNAKDDSGETFKVIATGNYNALKRYDGSKAMSKFLSSDPTGIDGNQLVALIDKEGNTFVRIYGTGGVYVHGNTPTSEASVVVKPDSAEADPNRLKKYTDKGYDIKLDPTIKEDMGNNFQPDIANKNVPQDDEALAEAKATILVTITKANLAKKINLDTDIAIRGGYIWLRYSIGHDAISNDQLKALCSDSKFRGINPISDTELTLIFDKN